MKDASGERLLRSGRWEEQQRDVTEAFGSFQAVATSTFLAAGRTAAHAADAGLVTAWKTSTGHVDSRKAKSIHAHIYAYVHTHTYLYI